MKNLSKLTIFVAIMATALTAQSQVVRSIADVQVYDKAESNLNLTQFSPDDYWILIIVNKNLTMSQQMLEQLRDKRLQLDKTVVLVISNQSNNHTFEKQRKELPVQAWIEVDDSKPLAQLHLTTTPVVLGIHANQIEWKISGLSAQRDFKQTLLLINKWSNKNQIKDLIK